MHLKLGMLKKVVKAMNQEEVAFTYLWETFPRLSEAKLKEDVYIGPENETLSRTNTATLSFNVTKRPL